MKALMILILNIYPSTLRIPDSPGPPLSGHAIYLISCSEEGKEGERKTRQL